MRNFIAFSAAIVVGACSATTDPMSYSVGGVGIANRTSQATVIASKSVMIDLSNGEAGQGGLAGAMIVGASNSGSDAGGVVAAILVVPSWALRSELRRRTLNERRVLSINSGWIRAHS